MDFNKLRAPLKQSSASPQIQASGTIPTNSQSDSKNTTIPSINTLKPPSNPRNTSTLLPPKGSHTNSGALFPAANSNQRAGARSKVRLEPGHSPLDWAHLNSSGKNLRGINPSEFPVRVTKEILQIHKHKDDCWTVLSGKVYNITPYLKFHPGGVDELMKCAGKDGTSLFMKYHAWVNFERMLENCLVGFYLG
ncbi:hypothetical protein WICPIJ_004235 [Wickerhamomyces pijperi]|uniref:Cytochrome b5 heme-binding domain-containing protein n=1 Tax=Wickerhamomyces pijperi TaxID=599730 RepID=A0A9P8TNG2_WICPI|nr:hypothetical protein WICPIJ_004235 [Wickerhamomyces pijperi]